MSTIETTFKEPPNRVIWFHCASLGEFEQGRPLMELIKRKNPNQKIVLTFFPLLGMKLEKIIKEQIISIICHSIQLQMPASLFNAYSPN